MHRDSIPNVTNHPVPSRGERYNEFMRGRVCQDCGESNPKVLEWHHRDPTTKRFSVSNKNRRVPFSELLEEIAKCDLVCRACHVRRHYGIGTAVNDNTSVSPSADIGARVREIRLRLGMTQDQLASAIKTSKSTVCRIERGDPGSQPLHTLSRLADVFGVALADIVGTETNEFRDQIIREERASLRGDVANLKGQISELSAKLAQLELRLEMAS